MSFPFSSLCKGLIFTKHAQRRMRLRSITHADIIATLTKGKSISVFNRQKELVLKFEHNNLTVITDLSKIKIITAFKKEPTLEDNNH